MITTAEREAIPGLVLQYKRCEPLSRKMLFEKCAYMARQHPEKDTRDLNTLLYLELLKAEKELTPAETTPPTENPIPSPAEFNAAAIAILKPVGFIFGTGGVLYILGAAVVSIAESTAAFFLAWGWVVIPAGFFLAMLAWLRSGKNGGNSAVYNQPNPAQNIHINITGSDGRINVTQQ